MRLHKEKIVRVLGENAGNTDWEKMLRSHQRHIKYFQHERLVHLLVMLTVGIALLLSMFMTMIYSFGVLLIADTLLMLLFIPYLIHYRKLENGVQELYRLTDRIEEKIT